MAGYWEIWELQSRNMLGTEKSEQALAVVRDIVGEGSTYSDLMLLFDDADLELEDLPTPVTGDELARRAGVTGQGRLHRTAAPGRNMADEGYRLFYRIVRTYPPSLVDFTSNAALGKRVPTEPELAALWDGLSVQSTLAQARRRRRASPMLGDYIAVLRVPTDGSVRNERTLSADGHHTLWGDPAVLLALVVSVEPV